MSCQINNRDVPEWCHINVIGTRETFYSGWLAIAWDSKGNSRWTSKDFLLRNRRDFPRFSLHPPKQVFSFNRPFFVRLLRFTSRHMSGLRLALRSGCSAPHVFHRPEKFHFKGPICCPNGKKSPAPTTKSKKIGM